MEVVMSERMRNRSGPQSALRSRAGLHVAFALVLAAAGALGACGGSESDGGAGTGAGGSGAQCGAGTTLVNGACIPACGTGTVFDPGTGMCVAGSSGGSGTAGSSSAGAGGGAGTSGGAGGESGAAGASAGASGSSTAGASGAGGFANGDSACPTAFIDAGMFLNCSDTCGPNTCSPGSGGECASVTLPGPGKYVIRLPSHPGKSNCVWCKANEAGAYRMVVKAPPLADKTLRAAVGVAEPWVWRSTLCTGAEMSCRFGGPFSGNEIEVVTLDENAPSRNLYVSYGVEPLASQGKIDTECLEAIK